MRRKNIYDKEQQNQPSRERSQNQKLWYANNEKEQRKVSGFEGQD